MSYCISLERKFNADQISCKKHALKIIRKGDIAKNVTKVINTTEMNHQKFPVQVISLFVMSQIVSPLSKTFMGLDDYSRSL